MVVVKLGQQYITGEKPTVWLCTLTTYTLIAMQGHQKKQIKKIIFSTYKHMFIIIYNNSAIDLYTTRASSLEHK